MSREEVKNMIVQFAKTYEYSNLITIDESGFPKGRMMENLPLGPDLVFWFATGIQSNKIREIKNGSSGFCVGHLALIRNEAKTLSRRYSWFRMPYARR